MQYAHARIKSVIRKAEALNVDTSDYALSEANLSSLTHASELSLIKKLAEWPRIVELSARLYEPHRLAFYLFDLSSELHSHWGKGGENPHLRFLQSDDMPQYTQYTCRNRRYRLIRDEEIITPTNTKEA